MVEWEKIGRDRFDRIVEALLEREYSTHPTMSAHAIDGRGGDGGIDVDIVDRATEETVGTYQLKYFPGGMSGGFTKRRAQVKRSMAAAARIPTLTEWVLVLPRNPTKPEKVAVRAMRPAGSTFSVKVMGRAWLDGLDAKHPDIARSILRDETKALLAQDHLEHVLPDTPGALASRFKGLSEVADGLSENWGLRVTSSTNSQLVEVFPKRTDAQEREPIGIRFNTAFGTVHKDLEQQFTTGVDYGFLEPVSLPPEVVADFDFTGPDWVKPGGGELIGVTVGSAQHSPRKVELRVVSNTGATLASLVGQTTARDVGKKGGSIRASFSQGLDFVLRADAVGRAVNLQFTFSLVDISASEAKKAVRFGDAVFEGDVEIAFDGGKPMRLGEHVTGKSNWTPITDYYRQLIDDLVEIEREFDLTIPVPNELTGKQRIDIRVLKLLLDGYCVWLPGNYDVEIPVNQSDPAKWLIEGSTGASLWTDGHEFEVVGHKLYVGPIGFALTNMVVADKTAARAVLDADFDPDARIGLTPSSTGFSAAWLPIRRRARGRSLTPVGWAIPDFDEPQRPLNYDLALLIGDSEPDYGVNRELHGGDQ